MGQRLNIEIVYKREENTEDEVVLANAYYHWSAYTTSANYLALKIVEKIEKDNFDFDSISDKRLYAIRLLEATGALVANEDHDAIAEIYPDLTFKKAESRNDGLISYSEKGIEDTRNWEEGRITIYLKDKTVNATCHHEYDDRTQYFEDYEAEEDDIVGSEFHADTSNMTFEEFRQFDAACDYASENGYSAFESANGDTIIALIE